MDTVDSNYIGLRLKFTCFFILKLPHRLYFNFILSQPNCFPHNVKSHVSISYTHACQGERIFSGCNISEVSVHVAIALQTLNQAKFQWGASLASIFPYPPSWNLDCQCFFILTEYNKYNITQHQRRYANK